MQRDLEPEVGHLLHLLEVEYPSLAGDGHSKHSGVAKNKGLWIWVLRSMSTHAAVALATIRPRGDYAEAA